jgi:signal transduction histidine kinase/ligand-binding sensor domain-containing protein
MFINYWLVGIIVSALALPIATLQAQSAPKGFPVEHLPIPGIIKSTYTADIEQDEYGIMWFGTSSGLFQYNGNEFEEISFLSNRYSLSVRQITDLLWDEKHKQLLIGTRTMGLLRFTYRENKITSITQSEDKINSIAQTADGRVWISSPHGLFELVNNQKLALVNVRLTSPTELLAFKNSLYVGDVLQVVRVDGGKISMKFPFDIKDRSAPANMRASALMLDQHNKLWVGTEREGIILFDMGTGAIVKEILPDQRPFFSRINRIFDYDGNVWILTKAEGIAVYEQASGEFTELRQDVLEPNSLTSNNCYSIFKDRSGILWIGANGSINYYDPRQRKFRILNYNPRDKNSLSDNMVRSVYEAPDKRIWVGTDGGFINIVDDNTGQVERVEIKGKDLPTNEAIVPYCYTELDDATTLLGTTVGMLAFDHRQKTFQYFKPLRDTINGRRVRQMVRDGDRLYCVVLATLLVYDVKSGEYSSGKKSSTIEATALLMDSKQRLWYGAKGSVSLIDSSLNSHVSTLYLTPDSLDFMILSIQETTGSIWVSTMNHGIFELIERDNQLSIARNITDKNGLIDDTAYGTVPDGMDNLWIPTNRGIARLNLVTGFIEGYQMNEGLQAEEYNRLAFTALSNGDIVFGGINGINIFKPRHAIALPDSIIPMIFSLVVRNDRDRSDVQNVKSILFNSVVELTHQQNFFTVHFGTTSYRQPKKYSLYYKLENYDEEWIMASEQNMANYHNIMPGKYTFRVKSVSQSGQESETSTLIILRPPLWMTWWFRIILSMLVITVAVISFKYKMNRDRKDKYKLEQLLKARTREIEQSKEQLTVLNEKKDLIFSILSHDLRSPLTTLKGFLTLLIENGDSFSREDIIKHSEQIRNSVTNSLDLIDNTLFWSLSQMGGIQCNPVKVSITQMIGKVKGLYQLALDRKSIHLQVSIDDDLNALADENMLYVTLRNLVSNAIKFTPAGGRIFLTVEKTDATVTIKVQDEGIGMSNDYIRKLLTQEHPTIKKGTSNEKGTGLGLVLCQEFIKANKGEMHIASEEGKGSTFTIILPVSEEVPA